MFSLTLHYALIFEKDDCCRSYFILNPTIPIFEVVQNALVIAQVIIILAEVVSLMIRLVTIQFATMSQPEAVAACAKIMEKIVKPKSEVHPPLHP